MSFNVGDEMTLSVETALAGSDVDDPDLTLVLTDPNGSVSSYGVGDLTEGDTGHYSYVFVVTVAGAWRWEWITGAGIGGSSSGIFLIGVSVYRFAAWATPTEVLNTAPMRALASQIFEDNPQLRDACDAATEYLISRTWRRFRGLREVELRPCCSCGGWGVNASGGYFWPSWTQVAARAAQGDSIPVVDGPAPCGCTTLSEVVIPDDLQLVTEVRLDGATFTDWRIDSGRRLTRTDDGFWPCCSDLRLPDSEVGTFSVHGVVGSEAPAMGRMAAAELASELFLAVFDPSTCRIPTRISTVNRQGATYTRVDTTTVSKDGMVGLRLTDLFLGEFGKRRRRLAIASPDVNEDARRIGSQSNV